MFGCSRLLNATFYHFKEQVSDLAGLGDGQNVFVQEMTLEIHFEVKFLYPPYFWPYTTEVFKLDQYVLFLRRILGKND